jgi:predicted transcriptional regulator
MVAHPAADPVRAFERETASTNEATDKAALVALGRERLQRMVDLFGSADQQQPTWTWASQQDVAFITRHQVQEAAVHRWDAQAAAGVAVDPIAADVAADSVDEFLVLSRPALTRGAPPMPGTVHLHCTDVDGEWFVQPDGAVERIHAKGDVALRGSAADLLLALYRRVAIDQLDVVGDRTVGEAFLSVHLE